MSTSTAHSLRCPRCSATLRAGTEWCSLCYADLRPRREATAAPVVAAPAAAPLEPVTEPETAPPVLHALTPPAAGPGRRGGKHARTPQFGEVTAPDQAEVERLAGQLLAELAATEGGSPLGGASGLVDSIGKRVALTFGVGLGVLVVIVCLMALVGALL